jgi:hypothetical protein
LEQRTVRILNSARLLAECINLTLIRRNPVPSTSEKNSPNFQPCTNCSLCSRPSCLLPTGQRPSLILAHGHRPGNTRTNQPPSPEGAPHPQPYPHACNTLSSVLSVPFVPLKPEILRPEIPLHPPAFPTGCPRSGRTAMFIVPRGEKTFLAPAGRHVLFPGIPQTMPLLLAPQSVLWPRARL